MPVYISPAGHKRMVDEFTWLLHQERPRITSEVSYAASLGDRSENSEYIYGKQRLREIDRRLRFLQKRLEDVEVVDPSRFSGDTVLFGAEVEVEEEDGDVRTWTILGGDEVDTDKGIISYESPLGRALMGKKTGATVTFKTPKGDREVTIVSVRFPARIG